MTAPPPGPVRPQVPFLAGAWLSGRVRLSQQFWLSKGGRPSMSVVFRRSHIRNLVSFSCHFTFPSLSLFLKGENCKQSVIKRHLQAHVGLLMIIIIMNKLSSLRMRSSVTFHRNN